MGYIKKIKEESASVATDILRRVLGVRIEDKIRNNILREKLHVEDDNKMRE